MVGILYKVIDHGISFEGKLIEVEGEVLLLSFVEERVGTLCLEQDFRYLLTGIRANRSLMVNNAIGDDFVEKIIESHLRQGYRYILRRAPRRER